MLTVVLTGANGVIEVVVLFTQRFPTLRVLPDPALECFPNQVLPLLCQDRFLGIQLPRFLAAGVGHGVVNAAVLKI